MRPLASTPNPKRHEKRVDDADAFVPDPSDGRGGRLHPDDAESFAEEFIASATSAEYVALEATDEVSDEEDGGPFVELAPAELEDIQDASGFVEVALAEAEPKEAERQPAENPARGHANANANAKKKSHR